MGNLPFAINANTGELVGVMEYTPVTGSRDLVCPACHQPLLVHDGSDRYHFEHNRQADCRMGAKVGVMVALMMEMDKLRCEPITINLPPLRVRGEIPSPENPALFVRKEVIWQKPTPPVTIIKGRDGPQFYLRFIDSASNNLGVFLPNPCEREQKEPDWMAAHVRRDHKIGMLSVDYSVLLHALSVKLQHTPAGVITASELFELFLLEQGAKLWLYHPRESSIRNSLILKLREQFPTPPPPQEWRSARPADTCPEPPQQHADDDLEPPILLSPEQMAELISRDGAIGGEEILYSCPCQLEINRGWLVLKKDQLWLIDRNTTGNIANRTIRFAGGMRSGRYVQASADLVRSFQAAVGYGHQ